MRYQPSRAGRMALHLWCEEEGKGGTRVALPGSPFTVQVPSLTARPLHP